MEDSNVAIPLIVYSEQEGFKVTQEALDFLKAIQTPVAVVAVAGKYRTGKSYLLNRVLLNRKRGGFGVGPTINPCTKGLWIWSEPIEIETNDGERCTLLVVDSEGIGAFDEDANHDTRVFLLALLLSSFFVYNSVGNIDESALQNLSLIVNLTKQLQIRANDAAADVEELANYFPSFLWVLRDFALQLVDPSGNPITTREYLENSLQEQRGTSDNIESKNRIRKLLKHFFKERSCFALVRPTEDEGTLQRLQEADERALRPEFMDQVDKLQQLIFRKVKPKSLNGKLVTGEMLGGLAIAYTEAINKGSVPNIEGAWNYVCQTECIKSSQTCLKQFDALMKAALPIMPVTLEQLEEAEEKVELEVLQLYRQSAVGSQAQEYEVGLKKQIKVQVRALVKANDKALAGKCKAELEPYGITVSEKLRRGEYSDFYRFRRELEDYLKEYKEQSLASTVVELQIRELADKLTAEAAEYIVRGASQEAQNQSRRLQQQVEYLEAQLDVKRKEFNSEKDEMRTRLEKSERDCLTLRAAESSWQARQCEAEADRKRIEQRFEERLAEVRGDSKERYEDLKRRYDQTQASLNELQMTSTREIADLQKDKALLTHELGFKRTEAEEAKRLKNQFEDETDRLRTELRKAKAELDSALDEADKSRKGLREFRTEDRAEPSVWSAERTALKTQVDTMKSQVDEYKSVQEALMQALQNRPNETPRHIEKAFEANKHLSFALDKLETRCQQLEEKVQHLKKFKKMVKNSSALQCKMCGKNLASAVFSAHLSVCQRGPARGGSTRTFTIIVSQTLVRELPDQKPFTEYLISVTYGGKSWTINRRYKMFCNLHSALQSQLPHVELPDTGNLFFQPTSLFSRQRPLDERRRAFQQYLSDLSMIPVVRDSATFRRFLGVDAHYSEDSPMPTPEMTEPPTMRYSHYDSQESLQLSPIRSSLDYA
jgi:hypothetical protein